MQRWLSARDAGEGGRPALLVGESSGGVLALGVALRHPSSVSALALVNPATSYEGSPMACVECSAGTFASSATECKPCAAGKYQPDDGKSECIDVKEGHGATDIGAFTPPSQDEVRAAGADEAF